MVRTQGSSHRHPALDSGKGTLRLPVGEAADISDDELRAFAAAVLGELPLPDVPKRA